MKLKNKIANVSTLLFVVFNLNAQNYEDQDELKLGITGPFNRNIGQKEQQRALVHFTDDQLIINYDGDFEGGTIIDSDLTVNGGIFASSLSFKGNDITLGTGGSRDVGQKTEQRALVHFNNDRLIINYDGDFEGGTLIDSNLAVNGKIESKELKIKHVPTADYVFETNYRLISLTDLKKSLVFFK